MEARINNSSVLHAWLKSERVSRLSKFVSKNSNALAANISLGFLLGIAPQVLKFFGLPIEVRHVTLAMGSFAATLPQALGMELGWFHYVNSLSGILAIGVINISVAFSLAFVLACASSQILAREFLGLIWWGLKLTLTRPWSLILPAKKPKFLIQTIRD
jgi:site-specific recombinase